MVRWYAFRQPPIQWSSYIKIRLEQRIEKSHEINIETANELKKYNKEASANETEEAYQRSRKKKSKGQNL